MSLRPTPGGLAALQAAAGNRAVGSLLSPVQRQDIDAGLGARPPAPAPAAPPVPRSADTELRLRLRHAVELEVRLDALRASTPRRRAVEAELVEVRLALIDLLIDRIARREQQLADLGPPVSAPSSRPSGSVADRLAAQERLEREQAADRHELVPLLAWRTRLELRAIDRGLDAERRSSARRVMLERQRRDVLAVAVALTAPVRGRTLSDAGADLIKSFEGGPYLDRYDPGDPQRATVGWGHKIVGPGHPNGGPPGPWVPREFRPGVITLADAERLFRGDTATAVAAVNRLVTVPLTQEQFDALVSFAFNGGPGMLRQLVESSGLNEGHYDAVTQRLPRFNHADRKVSSGLTRRRAREATRYDAGSEVGRFPDPPRPPRLVPPGEVMLPR
ncbi:MAG TPA: lysozyme [Pseudonocardiaceae bacterium]